MAWSAAIRRFSLILVFLSISTLARAGELPRIVTTIPPIHSLVAAVTEGVVDPVLLVRGGSSPHTYAMAPSDARAIQNAQLIVWVGPNLETFLARALRDPHDSRRIITLMNEDGMLLLDTREGGIFEGHDDDHDVNHDEAHRDDDHFRTDAHLWLDPLNAMRTVEIVAEALINLDPERAQTYRANAAQTLDSIARLDKSLAATFASIEQSPFFVFHDAYQYLENRYGLSVAGSITVSPDRKPGARRLREIQQRISQESVACIFAEPQFSPSVIESVTEGTAARTSTADPLGAELEPGSALYTNLMFSLARSFSDCLSPRS
ncbi:MAG: zinc ABC transporter substrate-binding protein [Alphaproteobacteria bacterium]|nr:zinc ABC transporter substrate-binding protein [Alphaproteobacteria bacterium]